MKRLTEKQFIDKTTRQLLSHAEANKVKSHLEKCGYNYAISLYGVIRNPKTGQAEYRRIEVFLNAAPKEEDVSAVHEFFREIKPYLYYTLWAYNTQRKEIVMIAGFE